MSADEAEKVKPRRRGVSHQVAFFFALAAGVPLVALAPGPREAWAALVYALSLAGMYGISALYHRRWWSLPARRRMRRLDHACIFLLIAGTYTPVCVVGLPGPMGRALLAVVWGGATLGLLHALFFVNAFRSLNVVLYVVLGCAVAPLLPATVEALGAGRTSLLVAGGVVYITGAVVYARRRPNPNPAVFGYHEVFHLMVIAASALHFASVFDLVVSL
ncbi:MAG: membrane protein [Myxococcaceae bacterium]